MWRETTRHERNLKIFQEELDGFLPERILDFHVHIMNEGVAPKGKPHRCAGHPIDKYDLDDLAQDLAEVYPRRETYAVCFGMPLLGYNQAMNDRYIAENCDHKRFFPFRLFDPNEPNHDAVWTDIDKNHFLGLKPYLDYVRKRDVNDVEIQEMLPPWIMEAANERALIIMLHIPRKARLADDVNQRQIVQLCERYPRARIVLAHVGRAYFMKNVVGHLDALSDIPNLWVDLAMLNNWEVLEHVFRVMPPRKLLYATDIPIALAPGKSVEINDQYTYVTPVPWELSISDDHSKLVFTSFLYEELRAIKKAVQRLALDQAFVRSLFFDNGMRLIQQML